MRVLEKFQLIVDVDLQLAVIQDCLKEVAVGVVLRILHVEFVDFCHSSFYYLPEGVEIGTIAEDEVQKIDSIHLRLFLLLLTQLLHANFGHVGLCFRVECLSRIMLHFLLRSEQIMDELFLVVAVELPYGPRNSVHFCHGFDVGQLSDFDHFAEIAHVDAVALHDLAEVGAVLDHHL